MSLVSSMMRYLNFLLSCQVKTNIEIRLLEGNIGGEEGQEEVVWNLQVRKSNLEACPLQNYLIHQI